MGDQAAMYEEMAGMITDVLIASVNPRDKNYEHARNLCLEWEDKRFPIWVTVLAVELADENKSLNSREIAGVNLRSALAGKEDERKEIVLQRWRSVPTLAQTEVKNNLLAMMNSHETKLRHAAAEAVAQIAILDLPFDSWRGVIDLLTNAVSNGSLDVLQEASLISISSICVGLHPDILRPHALNIIWAVLAGMQSPHKEIQLYAAKALNNAIAFSHDNFSDPEQRKNIMQELMKVAASPFAEVRYVAFECLVSICTAFYEVLPDHMRGGLFELILETLNSETDDNVLLQAIEIWSSICEEEIDIYKENLDNEELGIPLIPCHNFIKGAVSHIALPLCICLTRGQRDPDLETWTVSTSAASCIRLITQTLADSAIEHFIPWIMENIQSEDPIIRESAVLCFGELLEGPSTEEIGPHIQALLGGLLGYLKDPQTQVKLTSAWVISQIAMHHPAAINDFETFLSELCSCMITEIPSIAYNCVEAIYNLAMHVTSDMRNDSPLNPYMNQILEHLMMAGEREDASEASLSYIVNSAISSLVLALPDSAKDLVFKLLNTFVPRLRNIMAQTDPDSRDLQSEYCGLLTVCTRVAGNDIINNATELTEIYLTLLEQGNSFIYQEVFMALQALIDVLGPAFIDYLPSFGDQLFYALNQFDEPELYEQALLVTNALTLSLREAFEPFCNSLIQLFSTQLSNPTFNQSLVPSTILAFADIASVLQGNWASYMDSVLAILENYKPQATVKTESISDINTIKHIQELRYSMLFVYAATISACSNNIESVQNYISSFKQLLSHIAADTRREDKVNRISCTLIRDIAETQPQMNSTLKMEFEKFILYCLNSQSSSPETMLNAQSAMEAFH